MDEFFLLVFPSLNNKQIDHSCLGSVIVVVVVVVVSPVVSATILESTIDSIVS